MPAASGPEWGPSVAQAAASSPRAASSLRGTGAGVCGAPAQTPMERARLSPSRPSDSEDISVRLCLSESHGYNGKHLLQEKETFLRKTHG